MDTSDLIRQTAELNLLNRSQRELVETSIQNLELGLYGRAMTYSGSDFEAQQYQPGDGRLDGQEPGSFLGRQPPNVPEPELLRHNLRLDRATLERGTAPELSGHRKDLLYHKYNEELPKYREGLLSQKQMWEPSNRNVQHFLRHQEANVQRGKFLANVRRILDPAEEGFSLDDLRPDTPVHVDYAAFRQNFDQIRWTESEELERQVTELDDALYLRFLEEKYKTDDAAVIRSRLTIDQATYEACEARLQSASPTAKETPKQQEAPAGRADTATHAVTDQELGHILQAVLDSPGLTHNALKKQTDFKRIGMTVIRFSQVLKFAVEAGYIDKIDKKYTLSTVFTEESDGDETEISADDSESLPPLS